MHVQHLGIGGTFLATLVAANWACRSHTDGIDAKPVNVVLIVADDLGYMDVGFNAPDCFIDTPNLDRLAKAGIRFTDAYAASPVCSPTRYSLMTGKYPTRGPATQWFSGKRAERFLPAEYNDRMPLEEVTVAEALQEHGYTTFFAGKWHLGPTPEHWPERQGFDINKGGTSKGNPGKGYFSPYNNPRLEDGPEGEHLPARLGHETAAFIREHKDAPFFANLSFYSPHTPLIARQDLIEKYRQRAQESAAPNESWESQSEPIEVFYRKRRKGRERVREVRPVYAAMVEAMDLAIGEVLDALDEAGVSDNTLVIFTSDNGGLSTAQGHPTSNRPLKRGKGWVYEGGIREPMVMRLPGTIEPGLVDHTPVITNDLYPTILATIGRPLRPQQHLDGVSLLPLLHGGGARLQRDTLYWHYPHYSDQGGFPGGAIRQGDWKLIENYETGTAELYNLADDLGETTDLVSEKPKRAASMRRTLHTWYRKLNARFLRPRRDQTETPWRPEDADH